MRTLARVVDFADVDRAGRPGVRACYGCGVLPPDRPGRWCQVELKMGTHAGSLAWYCPTCVTAKFHRAPFERIAP